jgi:hypothetical protein
MKKFVTHVIEEPQVASDTVAIRPNSRRREEVVNADVCNNCGGVYSGSGHGG